MLPAALASLLAVMLALQLALTSEVELPPAGAAGIGAAQGPPPAIRPAPVPPGLLARPLFAPHGAASGSAPANPLGATLVGAVRIGHRAYAVVQQGGRTINVPVGGSVAGWRLAGLSAEAARFVRGNERLVVGYGAAAGGVGTAVAAEESEGE